MDAMMPTCAIPFRFLPFGIRSKVEGERRGDTPVIGLFLPAEQSPAVRVGIRQRECWPVSRNPGYLQMRAFPALSAPTCPSDGIR